MKKHVVDLIDCDSTVIDHFSVSTTLELYYTLKVH